MAQNPPPRAPRHEDEAPVRPRPCSCLRRRRHRTPSPRLWVTRAPLIHPSAHSPCVSLPGDLPVGFGNSATLGAWGCDSLRPCAGECGVGLGVGQRSGKGQSQGQICPVAAWGKRCSKWRLREGSIQTDAMDRRTDTVLPGDSRWGTVLCGAEVMGGDSCVCTAPSKTTGDDRPPG